MPEKDAINGNNRNNIKIFLMVDYSNLTNEQKNQLSIDARYLALSCKLMLIPLAIAIVSRVYFYINPEQACSLIESQKLLLAWPRNLALYDQLLAGKYPPTETCTFLAMNSIISIGWAIWFFSKLLFEIRRKDFYFMPMFTRGIIFVLPILLVIMFVGSFTEAGSQRGYSLVKSADENIFISFLLISPIYACIGHLFDRILLLYRRNSRNNITQHR